MFAKTIVCEEFKDEKANSVYPDDGSTVCKFSRAA